MNPDQPLENMPTHYQNLNTKDDLERDRFPFCIVWTPLPLITWFFPFIGHTGICYSNGIIRDFAGPYTVTEDNMAFGRPTRLLRLDPNKVKKNKNNHHQNTSAEANNINIWDHSVYEASEIYKGRMHNLCCDNCHSHVCTALDLMEYDGKSNWNMVKLAFWVFFFGEYITPMRTLYTWGPFLLIASTIALLVIFL